MSTSTLFVMTMVLTANLVQSYSFHQQKATRGIDRRKTRTESETRQRGAEIMKAEGSEATSNPDAMVSEARRILFSSFSRSSVSWGREEDYMH